MEEQVMNPNSEVTISGVSREVREAMAEALYAQQKQDRKKENKRLYAFARTFEGDMFEGRCHVDDYYNLQANLWRLGYETKQVKPKEVHFIAVKKQQ